MMKIAVVLLVLLPVLVLGGFDSGEWLVIQSIRQVE